jgi:hypothetical protein
MDRRTRPLTNNVFGGDRLVVACLLGGVVSILSIPIMLDAAAERKRSSRGTSLILTSS